MNILVIDNYDSFTFNLVHLLHETGHQATVWRNDKFKLSDVNDFEKMWKSHCQNRSSMQNKLLGKKNSLRDELVQRVMLQYKFRSFHVHTILNEVDLRIIDLLFKLF